MIISYLSVKSVSGSTSSHRFCNIVRFERFALLACSFITSAIPGEGSTAVTDKARSAKGIARVPGPAPMSRIRLALVIGSRANTNSILSGFSLDIFKNSKARSFESQVDAQSPVCLNRLLASYCLVHTSAQFMIFLNNSEKRDVPKLSGCFTRTQAWNNAPDSSNHSHNNRKPVHLLYDIRCYSIKITMEMDISIFKEYESVSKSECLI